MRSRNRLNAFAAIACATGLALSGAGMAAAQDDMGFGSVEGTASSNPVFDSPSTAALTPAGAGKYTVTYQNKSPKDLACVGYVLPESVSKAYFEYMKENIGATEAPEPDAALEAEMTKAMEAGHLGIVVGEDGLTMRQVLRAQLAAQMGEDVTDEQIDAYLDMMMAEGGYGAIFELLDEALEGKTVVNFVDKGDTATWSATLGAPLTDGAKAGGILGCFDGIGKDAKLTEATYLELEHADQGSIPGGALDSGSLGSLTGSLGS